MLYLGHCVSSEISHESSGGFLALFVQTVWTSESPWEVWISYDNESFTKAKLLLHITSLWEEESCWRVPTQPTRLYFWMEIFPRMNQFSCKLSWWVLRCRNAMESALYFVYRSKIKWPSKNSGNKTNGMNKYNRTKKIWHQPLNFIRIFVGI